MLTSGGVFIAGDQAINPQLVDFTSAADVVVLSQNGEREAGAGGTLPFSEGLTSLLLCSSLVEANLFYSMREGSSMGMIFS